MEDVSLETMDTEAGKKYTASTTASRATAGAYLNGVGYRTTLQRSVYCHISGTAVLGLPAQSSESSSGKLFVTDMTINTAP